MYRKNNPRERTNSSLGYGHYARTMFPPASFKFPPVHRDSDYNNTSYYTPIFLAVHRGNLNLAYSLLEEDSVENDIQGKTLMHVAAAKGHEQIICLLCKRNFHVDKGDRDGNTPLHLAIKGNHIDVVDLLSNENVVNLKNSSQETPLHLATTKSNIKFVEILLQNGAKVDEEDGQGNTALHIAVKKAKPNLKIITLLMDNKASVNAFCHAKYTPLYNAVSSGNIEVIKILIKYGTPIDIITKSGISPLVLAIQKNNTEIVRHLLNNGCHVDYEVTNNMTPMHYAAQCGNKEIVELLMKNGYGTVNARNEDLKTPLYFAATNGYISILKYLIEKGAEIESKIPENESLLHLCAINGRVEVLKLLIAHGAKIDVKTFKSETPLHLSASNGRLNIVKYLLECGADVNAKTLTKETPLHLAVKAGHVEIVKELLNSKADINSLASEECSALTFAVKTRKKTVVQLFLSKGAKDFECDSLGGEKALHVAAKNGDEEILKMLLEGGCSVNNSCKGKKPIHVAAIFGHRKSVEILIEASADIHSITKFRETPLHLAAASGRCSVVKFLLNAGANPKFGTDRDLTPLDYALDRARHTAIMKKTSINSLSRSLSPDSTSNTDWNVSPFMFEKYLEITEMLLSYYDSSNISDDLFHTLGDVDSSCTLQSAFRIRVSNEDRQGNTSNTSDSNKSKQNITGTGVIFRPEIVRCILNYRIKDMSLSELNSFINTTISMKTPQLTECLLEYDVQKSCREFQIICDESHCKTILNIIDHIEDIKIIQSFLFAAKVQREVQIFSMSNNLREATVTNLNVRTFRLRSEENIVPYAIPIRKSFSFLNLHDEESRISLTRSTYMDTLKLLVARLVQIRSASKESNVPESKELKILENYNLSEWYTDCEIQLMNMRETKIHHDFDVSYYDILSQPVNKLANYVRRPELMKILEFSCMKFPAYAEFLKRSVEKGKRRKELIDSSADCMLNVINKNHKLQLPSLVIDKLFDYLSVIDLLRVSQAGRLVYKKPLYTRGFFAGRKNKK